MSTELQRESSFRTTLKNQKRRLSATKLPTKPIVTPEQPTMATTLLKSVKVKTLKNKKLPKQDSLPSIDDSDCTEDDADESSAPASSREATPPEVRLSPAPAVVQPPSGIQLPVTPPNSRPASPYVPKKPSPLALDTTAANNDLSRPLSPACTPPVTRGRSPLPKDSPLLSHTPQSPTAKRVKEIRRTRSFRRSLERSRERSSSRAREIMSESEDERDSLEKELSFSIRRHLGGRQGWKIMPDEDMSLCTKDALQKVVGMIKEMELKGHVIPERITIKV